MPVIAVLKRCNTKETLIYLYRKMRGLVRRLKLAGRILLGRWSVAAAQRQAELQAAMLVPPDLEAVLLHSASVAIEVERLSTLYESLAVRIARLEQAAERACYD